MTSSVLSSRRTSSLAAVRRRRQELPGWAWTVLGPVIAVALWWLATEVVFARQPLVPEFSPARTVTGLAELTSSGLLVSDASASVFRLVSGLAIAAVVGITAGAAIGALAWLDQATRLINAFLRMVSPLS